MSEAVKEKPKEKRRLNVESSARVQRLIKDVNPDRVLMEISRTRCERSLAYFIETAWPEIEPQAPFRPNWHVNAIADHLHAVNNGQIKRLVLNLPPRSLKSYMVSVAWPMFTWAQTHRAMLKGPQVKFLCASYNQDLSWKLSTDSRRLFNSNFYQQRWGRRFKLTGDQNSKTQFDNTEGGSRFATSVGGSLLGIGGSILIVDDPHNIDGLTEVERLASIEWFKEFSSTRFNDPMTGALVLIMQRLHEEDITGFIQKNYGDEYNYVILPMEFEPKFYQVPTDIGFLDPRGLDDFADPLEGEELEERSGMLLHPERVPREEVERLKQQLGPYMASGRLQQHPVPEGGAILQEQWWNLWKGESFPAVGTVIASFDGAFTEKEENDPSALTVWGMFTDPTDGRPKIMLMDAWEQRLTLNNLVQAIAATCQKHRVDSLLIEARASGHSAAQEIQRLFGSRQWQTILINPKGDKVSRVHAIVPIFAAGLVFAPDTEWAQKVIDQAATFPKAAHDDLVDTLSQAISWLRKNGSAITKEEFQEEELFRKQFRKPLTALYDI